MERDTPPKLKSYNLQVNQSKTERYLIRRPIPEQYLPELDLNTNQNVLWSELDWIANIQHVTPENTSTNWNECKLLGPKLDTNADIKRRTILTLDAMKSLRHIFLSHNISVMISKLEFSTHTQPVSSYTILRPGP